MTTRKRIALYVVIIVALVALIFALIVASFRPATVVIKRSPDRKHTATLQRLEWVDLNFIVKLDGREIYRSPDFAPVPTEFREQLLWDTNSSIVLLEVAGRILFGYHAREKRALKDDELAPLPFTPFEELRFEGTPPKAR